MKKILIISPYFVPVNAADMHRIRQSISYYEENGWIPEVVMVNERFVEGNIDSLLIHTIPNHIKIHKVKAWSTKYTRRFGLGNIGYRSIYFYYQFVNLLLKKNKFDLILFSTTQFSICILGRFWRWKFNIPYVIDMQDPWRSDHYLSLPSNLRPPKFWISYFLDLILEKFTMKKVDGLLSVSQIYIDTLKHRYKNLINIPYVIVPFAAYKEDLNVAKEIAIENPIFKKNAEFFNMVYVGRGGHDMEYSTSILMSAIKNGLSIYDEFKKIRLYFIGTSYDVSDKAKKTFYKIAERYGIETYVIEIPRRVTYFESIRLLQDASILFVPGSDNIGYTASKIYNYVWMKKPLLTIFHSSSSVNKFMKEVNAGLSIEFDIEEKSMIENKIIQYILNAISNSKDSPQINWDKFEKYTAEFQVKKQIDLFNKIIK